MMASGRAPESEVLFEVRTPLGFSVRSTYAYWEKIVVKHPDVSDKVEVVKQTLQQPTEIRRSSQDRFVFLFYRTEEGYWLTAVAKKANEKEGYLVTCYRTDKMKEGEKIWPK